MGGDYRAFPSKILCVTVRKTFVGESFTVALILCIEKVWISVGEHQGFLSKVYCLSLPKFSVAESFTVAFFCVLEKFGSEWGSIKSFC